MSQFIRINGENVIDSNEEDVIINKNHIEGIYGLSDQEKHKYPNSKTAAVFMNESRVYTTLNMDQWQELLS